MTASKLNFDQFEVLTFDCYGTLIDWESGTLGALKKAFAAHNRTFDDKEILTAYAELEPAIQSRGYQLYRNILADVMRELGVLYNIVWNDAEAASLADSIPDWQPYPDTVHALGRLKSKYKLAIISNIDDDLFAHSARHLQVPFDHVITAQQVGSYKPSHRNFETTLKRIGLPKEKVLHVAESIYHDVVPAQALGIHTVWVNRRASREGLGASKIAVGTPDLEVIDLKSLAALAL
ncbi:MAG: haloacid dehalogenase, type [Acidobacteriaceae bacterium]|nr:haloacid dehalogenase, type [Acidobacteriaceae bacterium]